MRKPCSSIASCSTDLFFEEGYSFNEIKMDKAATFRYGGFDYLSFIQRISRLQIDLRSHERLLDLLHFQGCETLAHIHKALVHLLGSCRAPPVGRLLLCGSCLQVWWGVALKWFTSQKAMVQRFELSNRITAATLWTASPFHPLLTPPAMGCRGGQAPLAWPGVRAPLP